MSFRVPVAYTLGILVHSLINATLIRGSSRRKYEKYENTKEPDEKLLNDFSAMNLASSFVN